MGEGDERIVSRIVSDGEEGGGRRHTAKYRQGSTKEAGESYLKVVLIDVGGTRVKRHT